MHPSLDIRLLVEFSVTVDGEAVNGLNSARLQSLQVKQQLGVQAISIANQAPQTILSLFR